MMEYTKFLLRNALVKDRRYGAIRRGQKQARPQREGERQSAYASIVGYNRMEMR